MKHLKLIILLCGGLAVAQIQTPQPSPSTTLEQVVGLTEVKIEYSRPTMRGRTIMGDLVPYGSLWRTGANKNTTLSFSDPVMVGGQALASGTYALFTRPGKSLWEVFFYNETENSGLPKEWKPESIVAVIEVPTQSLVEPVESFTISINELTNTGANIHLSWENTRVTLPLEVPTDEKTMASIKETMKGTPKARDLYQAAVYYRESGRDLQAAKEWIGKAIEMDPGKYWMFRQQALILADLNEKEAAIKAAQSSLELAEKAGNQDYFRLNTKAIEEWSK
jgi:hypothetical protein